MRLFHRREETLNEKLLREAGLSAEGDPTEASASFVPADASEEDADDDQVVFTLDAPDLEAPRTRS